MERTNSEVLIGTITYEDTKEFIPPITFGTVVKVISSCCFIIASRLPYDESPLYRFPVRISDVIEKNDSNAKQWLLDTLMHKTISIHVSNIDDKRRNCAKVFYVDPDSGTTWDIASELNQRFLGLSS